MVGVKVPDRVAVPVREGVLLAVFVGVFVKEGVTSADAVCVIVPVLVFEGVLEGVFVKDEVQEGVPVCVRVLEGVVVFVDVPV